MAKLARATSVWGLGAGQRVPPRIQRKLLNDVAPNNLGICRGGASTNGMTQRSPMGLPPHPGQERGGAVEGPTFLRGGGGWASQLSVLTCLLCPHVSCRRSSVMSQWRTTARSGPSHSTASTTGARPPGR